MPRDGVGGAGPAETITPSAPASASTSTLGVVSVPFALRIIQINDVYELDNFPRLASLIQQYRDTPSPTPPEFPVDNESLPSTITTQPDVTVVICCGDFLAPSLLSSLDGGVGMVDCLRRVGVTHVCLGNHETDVGDQGMAERIAESTAALPDDPLHGDGHFDNGPSTTTQISFQARINRLLLQQQEVEQKISPKLPHSPSLSPVPPMSSPRRSLTSRHASTRRSLLGPSAMTSGPPFVPLTWLNTNMPGLDDILGLPPNTTVSHDVLMIQKPVTMAPESSAESLAESTTTSNTPVVVTQRIGWLGLLTPDPSLYRPGAFGNCPIAPIIECTEQTLAQHGTIPNVRDSDPPRPNDEHVVDLWIPLTHQSMAQDREFAAHFGGRQFPVVCGGHDHEPYDEMVNGSRIIKTGMDAEYAAVIDVTWYVTVPTAASSSSSVSPPASAPDSVQVRVQLLRTRDFPVDPAIQACVEAHHEIIREVESAKLFPIRQWIGPGMHEAILGAPPNGEDDDVTPNLPFSTASNRLGVSLGTTAMTTMIRMGMRCQCAILNAGSVRAGKVYDSDSSFYWSDLKSEIPFATEIMSLYLPGRVLQDTIRYSRRGARQDPPTASGGFLHTCSNIVIDPTTNEILRIREEPYDPDRLYLTALPQQFFQGIDNHQPLLDWAAAENLVMNEENAMPAKFLIVQVFSSLLWLQLGSFAELDRNRDGVLTRDEIRVRVSELYGTDYVVDLVVDNVLAVADYDDDGIVTPLDMVLVQFAATDLVSHVGTQEEMRTLYEIAASVLGRGVEEPREDPEVLKMVTRVHAVLDDAGDGRVERHEIIQRLGQLKRKDLLK